MENKKPQNNHKNVVKGISIPSPNFMSKNAINKAGISYLMTDEGKKFFENENVTYEKLLSVLTKEICEKHDFGIIYQEECSSLDFYKEHVFNKFELEFYQQYSNLTMEEMQYIIGCISTFMVWLAVRIINTEDVMLIYEVTINEILGWAYEFFLSSSKDKWTFFQEKIEATFGKKMEVSSK